MSRQFWASVVLPVWLLMIPGAALCAEGLSLTAVPAQVKLARGQSAELALLVKNEGPHQATALVLAYVPVDGLSVSLLPKPPESLPPGGIQVLRATVHRSGDVLQAGLQFYLSSRLQPVSTDGQSTNAARDDVATAELTVQQVNPTAVEELVGVEIQGSFDAIEDYRPGELHLLVKNKVQFPVFVTAVNVWKSKPPAANTGGGVQTDLEAFRISPVDGRPTLLSTQNTELRPGQAADFPCRLDVNERRTPGPQVILFHVELKWREHGQEHVGRIVLSHQFGLGVFGETALLTSVGVPAFFMLPGTLFLIACAALCKRVVKSAGQTPEWLPDKLEAAALSVAISFGGVAIYQRWKGVNLLESYGMRDVRDVWIGSLALGLLLGLLIVGLYLGVRLVRGALAVKAGRRAAEEQTKVTLTEQDSEWQVIERLAQLKEPNNLPLATVDEAGRPVRVVRLGRGSSTWTCGRIRITTTPAATDDERVEITNAVDGAPDDIAAVQAILRPYVEHGKIELRFERDMAVKQRANATFTNERDNLIQMEA